MAVVAVLQRGAGATPSAMAVVAVLRSQRGIAWAGNPLLSWGGRANLHLKHVKVELSHVAIELRESV